MGVKDLTACLYIFMQLDQDAICLRAIWVGRNGPIFSLSTPPHPHGHASPEEKRPRRARHPSRGALLARLSGPPSGLLPF